MIRRSRWALTLFLALLLQVNFSYCQSSFLRELSNLDGLGFFHPYLGNGDNGDISVLMKNIRGFSLSRLSSSGEVLPSFSVATALNDDWYPRIYKRIGNFHFISCEGSLGEGVGNIVSAVFVVNFETGIKWAKQVSNQPIWLSTFSLLPSNKIIISHINELEPPNPRRFVGLALFDAVNGEEIWSYYYRPMQIINAGYTFYPQEIEAFPNGDFSVLNQMSFSGTSSYYFSLTRISMNGNVKNSVVMEGNDKLQIKDQSIDGNGNVYLSGHIYSPEKGYNEGFVAKMDQNYHLLWAKKLTAEAFPSVILKIKSFSNGGVIFTYVTNGDLPVIAGKISSEEELLWHRGYSFYLPEITIGQDSSVYFSSAKKYYEDGTWEYSPIIAKTNSDGIIEGCEQFDACLELVDIDLGFTEEFWDRFDAPGLASYEVEVEPITFTATPHCGTPTPPRAEFSFPDTLCQYSCASPTNLKNRLANRVEWSIVGPGVDSTIIDSTFYWCFDTSGTYTIEQEIWLLGCSEFFSQTLEVLPDNLEVSLGEDRIVCEAPPYVLTPRGSRPLQTFHWNDGSEDKTLNILQSGNYSLIATDGYCSTADTVTLTFIDDLLDEVPLVLPPDERTCPAFLPYELNPQSVYSTSFLLNNALQDSTFSLTESGIYNIGVQIENCWFFEEFKLEIEDCHIPIYFGNAFSPNDDGINDLVFPQGQNFEGEKLQIFDRWGGLLYQTKAPPFSWDGFSNGKALNTGVYLLVFTYFNQLNLKEEVKSQEVLLLR